MRSLSSKASFRIVAALAIVILGTGTVFYHIVEKFRWLDSLYFSTVTLATVGYGDYTPHTDLGKLFTVFYILIGIGIIVSLANIIAKHAGERIIARRRKAARTKK